MFEKAFYATTNFLDGFRPFQPMWGTAYLLNKLATVSWT